ncbi:DUF2946 family protein [Phenylobacterium sp.]|jgi:hypothetical protein|uniref:DUF2946 family protein n=1 Tax=Phenylobacterium sp. TaxID=1871053 RepID=UPI002E34C489|nr:DUF2946 family protein [Phenylobacterium sp.]HEX3367499.1 DUF2946 family protein [Phenylobacterium sp.]
MPPARHATHDRRAIIALFVMFALMVQALMPTMAMAAPADGRMILCTAGGTKTLSTDGKSGAPAPNHGAPCHDCLAASLVATAPPPLLAIQPVAYALARVEHVTPADRIAPRARARPRPPGQGPPTA